jgi:hypothetical protein
MMSPCRLVTERLVAGEPLTPEEADHATRCVDCARLTGVPHLLATVAREPEPVPGFSARMQVGARRRLAQRRRRRAALVSLTAAGVVVAGVLIAARPAERAQPGATQTLIDQEPVPRPPPRERAAASPEQLARELVRVADLDGALGAHAPWDDLTDPLTPYRVLLVRAAAPEGAPR